jgi:hypothetical protein
MENNKKKVWIQTISGVDTQPFLRFVGDIPIDDLIGVLIKSRDNATQLGYDNLKIHIQEETGIVDIGLFGERLFNDKELQQIDEMSVIIRTKEISNTGLNRDELLERNTKIMGKKSKRIVKILTQQVSEKMADENYLRGLLDANLISMEEFLKITMSENGK